MARSKKKQGPPAGYPPEIKPDKQVLREIRQAKSDEAALKVIRDYGFARWVEGNDQGTRDAQEM